MNLVNLDERPFTRRPGTRSPEAGRSLTVKRRTALDVVHLLVRVDVYGCGKGACGEHAARASMMATDRADVTCMACLRASDPPAVKEV